MVFQEKYCLNVLEVMPKVSIIVPIYKVELYIKRCIDSLLRQTYKNFELILVDDGSPDNSGKICDEYAEKDFRIHVIHKENGGLSDARNRGIEWALNNSDSEWIVLVDSDDWVHYRYLEFLLDAVEYSGCGMAICDFALSHGETPIVHDNDFAFQIWNTEEFYCEKIVHAVPVWIKIFPKKDFVDLRFPVGKIHEDEYVTHKILFKYPQIAYIDMRLYYNYQHSDSITKSPWTPEKLSIIEATEKKIEFFYNNGFIKAYRYSFNILFHNIQKNIQQIEESERKDYSDNYLFNLKKKRKKILKTCIRKKIFTLKNNKWEYELVYPKTMGIYWAIKSKHDQRK